MHDSRPFARAPGRRVALGFLVFALFAVILPARADAAPVVIGFTTTPALTGSVLVAFDQPVEGVTTANVLIRPDDGTDTVAADLTCVDATGTTASCAIGDVRLATLHPQAPLRAGQIYVATVDPPGVPPVIDKSGNAAPQTSQAFRASINEQESSLAAAFSWRRASDPAAAAGAYSVERLSGARATYRFSGPSVTWLTRAGPADGRASVSIDGGYRGIVNNYASRVRWGVARAYDGLGQGTHRITITVRGEKGARRATGTWVAIDAFRTLLGTDTAPAVAYRWRVAHVTAASDGVAAVADARGASTSFVFRGPALDIIAAAGPDRGFASVAVDGSTLRSVDTYAPRARAMNLRFGGLADAVHTARVTVVGRKRARASGTAVAIDRWIVRLRSARDFRGLGTWVDLYDYGIDPATSVNAMVSHGVRTLYIQTARFNSDSDIAHRGPLGEWVERAHAAGIKVIGWYLPAYATYLNQDVRRTIAIATFRSPLGQALDGLGIDIEYKDATGGGDAFNQGITDHISRVRAGVGAGFAVGAIVPSPVAMNKNPSGWRGFPWAAIARGADVVLPMGYWSYRTRDGSCPADDRYCSYRYARGNVSLAREYTHLPVHVIGGIGNEVTTTQVRDFARGGHDEQAYGGSLYDFRTTASAYWDPLAGFNP